MSINQCVSGFDDGSVQIETVTDAKRRRADLIAKLVSGDQASLVLAERLRRCRKGRRCGSGSCTVCLRLYRRRLLRGAKGLFQGHPEWTRVSVIPAGLTAPAGGLNGLDLDRTVKRIRKRLERSQSPLNRAIVFGGVDFSFNVESNGPGYWQGHLYLLIATKKRAALKRAVRACLPAEPTSPRPFRFRVVENAAAAITYTFKGTFNRRSRYFVDGQPRTRNLFLKTRELREIMIYLNQTSIGARMLLRGVRRNGRRLQEIATTG